MRERSPRKKGGAVEKKHDEISKTRIISENEDFKKVDESDDVKSDYDVRSNARSDYANFQNQSEA